MSFDVPILFCVFNRPDLTSHVFESIARQKPKYLLIAGDGPRADRPDDECLVQRTKRIVERINWDCVVQTKFSSTNLGCRAQMSNAITWGFEQHEQLIILEDDCLPHDSFFPYCRELLEHYADNPRVMTVSGNSYPTGGYNTCSYRFSKYPLIWGWASWRRAWQHYDLEMSQWKNQETQQRVLDGFTHDPIERKYWRNIFDHQHAGEINTWDYSWTFASWANNGMTILPKQNLVSNIGFGSHATHTFDKNSPMANRRTFPISITSHADDITRDLEADKQVRKIVFEPDAERLVRKSLMARLWGISTSSFSTINLFQH